MDPMPALDPLPTFGLANSLLQYPGFPKLLVQPIRARPGVLGH
jgi:hypothetical protein